MREERNTLSPGVPYPNLIPLVLSDRTASTFL
jgi:hypothetical protein